MFYSYDLLCLRKKGRYSIIWYAATHGAPPRKTDLMTVNIADTCEELMEAIKIPAKKKNAPIRLSLYLASMLMHGACIVYKEQIIWYLHDFMNFMEKFHQSAASKIAISMRNIDKAEGAINDERRGRRRETSRRRKKDRLPPPDAAAAAAAAAELPPPPGLDEEAVMRQLEAQAASQPQQLFLDPLEDAAQSRALELEAQHVGARRELFSATDPLLLAQIVAQKSALPVEQVEQKGNGNVTEKRGKEEEEEKESHVMMVEHAAVAPVPEAVSTPLSLPTEDTHPLPEEHPAGGVAEALLEEIVPAGLEVGLEAESVPRPEAGPEAEVEAGPGVEPEDPLRTTPQRRRAPAPADKEAGAQKRPRLFPQWPIYKADAEARWDKEALHMLAAPRRVPRAEDDIPVLAVSDAAHTDCGSRWDDLRHAQERVRVRCPPTTPPHAADASTEIALHGSSRGGSLSHLSYLSIEQTEDIKRIQGQLKAIPELADASRESLLNPVGEEEAVLAVAVGGVEQYPEAPDLPPPPAAPVPDDVDEQPAPPPPPPSSPHPPLPQPGVQEQTVTSAENDEDPALPDTSPRTNWEMSRNTILEKLRDLWINGNGVTTFENLCPRVVPKERAAITFNILLHLNKDNVLKLEQEFPFGSICIFQQ